LLSIFAHSDAFAALSMTKKASRFSKAETAKSTPCIFINQ
jgi:hypothetical protein